MKDNDRDRVNDRTRTGDSYRDNAGTTNNLVRLKDADDLKIVKHDSDVRGWPVLTSDNMEVGKVDELIVDTNAMKVRYLIVDLYDDYAADKIDHYLLLPIGAARLHEKDNKVLVSGIKTTTVLNYPVYRDTPITREYEQSIRGFFDRGGVMNSSSGAIAGTPGAVAGTPSNTIPSNTMDRPSAERTIVRTDEDHIHGNVSDRPRSMSNTDTPATGRTIIRTDEDHIYGHATNASDDVHGTTSRHDVESSHMQDPDRIGDDTRADTDSLSGRSDRLRGERREPLTGNKPFGTPNFSTPADFNERSQTSGLTPRTGSLENKEINMGPSGATKDEWDAQRPHHQEGDWNETSNLNSSTSLSNDAKRGSNMGNIENRPQYHTDRERLASPEHVTRRQGDPSTDDFYDHEHFDEEVFYVRRRRKED
ncbi:PRC-barrel domain-containing protein [Cesiribacter sp. SM1]|uniref:PRC-barrel domain-containing protein n=1 Tax=Cesiribacter sp. SM1 TaxID=2861196 RepID=UPI001CD2F284|nr:PRC-barrel domain-containing protein [Cesiribacter sp. SM1]